MCDGVDDVSVEVEKTDGQTYVEITIDDFDGFDEDWREQFRDVNWVAVDTIIDTVQKECIAIDDDGYYREYVFNGFVVEFYYTSEDI
jgi:hypothetical protein